MTTTPKAGPLLHAILAMEDSILTGGASRANPHLPPAFLTMIERLHAGTRLARQELDGVLLEDVQGALFPRALLERCRVPPLPLAGGVGGGPTGTGDEPTPHSPPASGRGGFIRIVIGVDPPATAAGDACGIIVCGLGADGTGYVLADHSAAGLSPEQWARKVAGAADAWRGPDRRRGQSGRRDGDQRA